MDQGGTGEVSTFGGSLPPTQGTVWGADKSPMWCEMPPERVAACGETDTWPPAPGPWASQGASVNGTLLGTGGRYQENLLLTVSSWYNP